MAAKRPQSSSEEPNAADSQSRSPRLAGKVAVVTGASSGIGYAIARALAAEGCSVVITGRNESSLAKSAARLRREVQDGALVVPIVCDVRDAHSVHGLFDSVGKRFTRLDVLVNNAGIGQPPTALEDTTVEMWHDIVQTNLTGVFLCTRAALPLMESGATIINNLSVAAKQIFPKISAYTAAKTGAYGFTLSLREELIPRGIRVTALVAGATATPIWQQMMPDAPREHMIDVDSVAKAVVFAVLLPPKVNPSELRVDPAGGAL